MNIGLKVSRTMKAVVAVTRRLPSMLSRMLLGVLV